MHIARKKSAVQKSLLCQIARFHICPVTFRLPMWPHACWIDGICAQYLCTPGPLWSLCSEFGNLALVEELPSTWRQAQTFRLCIAIGHRKDGWKSVCGCDKHQRCQDIQPVPTQGENSRGLWQWPGHLGSRCCEDCLCQEPPVGEAWAGTYSQVQFALSFIGIRKP